VITHLHRGAYFVLLGDAKSAREAYQEALKIQPSFSGTCMAALLSRELKDETTRIELIAAMEKAVANPQGQNPRTPAIDKAGLLILELMRTGDASPGRIASVEASIAAIDDNDRTTRCAMNFYAGAELEALGQINEAEKFWRRSLVEPIHDRYVSALAGAKLAKLHGTSRPDDDALDETDLWPPLNPKQ
jgi:hypothetical protein